ncbi:rhomboid family intramembrane serine protease [Pontibacillus yanchengensis]|uniref:Rhomboid family intramembrane serine protease n=2 Tax=Pontibacillus yanchengensis TaxID=462910 RepID=A0ACC7VH43_9BACI|nr:rhomboid family intramembrane serine protease [Pontibacillus yanchengensis]MYL33471.1 rhomboid family intramembrane serine protease [Pontibacillus yanchengensis]MYL53521.1 rhomboid family intramembrane serine protease [Pontibacillus yanchengensis]
MYIEESYYFWRLAADLIVNHDYEILQMLEDKHEVWLEQRIKGKTNVVRLSHKMFDWSNQLKQDQTVLDENIKRVLKVVGGRQVHVHNVYIAKYPPVDDWNEWKDTRSLPGRKKGTVQTFYIDEQSRELEINQLYRSLQLKEKNFPAPSEFEMEQMVEYLKQSIRNNHTKKQQQREQVFFYGKPLFTYVLIVINLLLFGWLEYQGGSTNTYTLIQYGAKYNPAIIDGEWWRIVFSMFLHIGFFHIMLNMLALYVLGTAVERMFGSIRFIVIYFIGGIIGGLASFAFTPNVAAGASGAIYGLFGALLFFGTVYKTLFFRTIGTNVIIILILNIVFSIMVPQVDNGAHLGGLVGGFLASSLVHFPNKREVGKQLVSFLLIIALTIGLGWYGYNHDSNHYDARLQADVATNYIQQNKFQKAIDLTTTALNHTNSEQSSLYFVRGNGYVQLNKYDLAKEDYLQAIKLDPNFVEAHQNLSVLYYNVEQNETKALEHAKRVLELDSDNKEMKEFIQSVEENG